MIRSIEAFDQDPVGDWVADLSCLHRQHVRHRPPFFDRPWVETVAGRDDHLGAELDCSLCDRAEPPPGLVVARTAGPFDSATLPAGLRRDHRVGPRTWGRIRVLRSAVQLTMHTTPATDTRLVAGEEQHLPPGILHAVRPVGDVLVEVDFLTRPAPPDR